MHLSLPSDELFDFIIRHEKEDERKLLLRQRRILGFPPSFVANQLKGRRIAKAKLPIYYANTKVIFPPSVNLEQCSSQTTASFKSEVIKTISSTQTIIDLTGGFGVDAYFFSLVFKKVIYVEPDAGLLAIAKHNHTMLGAENVQYIGTPAEDFLYKHSGKADFIYLDPSRRKSGGKVFTLSDCLPNVVSLRKLLLQFSDHVLIKASPLLDLKQGIKELHTVNKIWVVSVENECRELLMYFTKNTEGAPAISAVNVENDRQPEVFNFTFQEELDQSVNFSPPQKYLYEPNVAILKAGAFKLVGSRFGLSKLAPNTHLYTSDDLRPDFPGRIFKLQRFIKKRGDFGKSRKCNVIARNYPLTVETLKKKFKLIDGGNSYAIAFSGTEKKYFVEAERLR